MGRDRVLAVVVPLLGAAEALAAVGAALRSRGGGIPEPELARRLNAVLDALDVRDAIDALEEEEVVSLLGLVESVLAQAADHVAHPGRIGWTCEEPRILTAQGDWSAGLSPVLRQIVVPALGGDLAERLDAPGASFLDVGTGVGALAIAMCRQWPSLRVVGLDPWEPALSLARVRVAAAGLSDRIDLRSTAGEELDDVAEHELAWLPAFFLSDAVLERVVERVHAALRPGGWAICGLYLRPPDPLAAALADLRTVRQGGAPRTPHELAELLGRAGYDDVDVLSDPAWKVPLVFVCGRRGDRR